MNIKKRPRLVVLVTILSVLVAVGLQNGRVSAIAPEQAGQELIALTNLNRTVNGLHALLVDASLNGVALSRSEDMIARQYFSHFIPPDNHTVINILQAQQYDFRLAGENIAWNTAADFASVQYANTQFMNSASHRVNILDPRFNVIGAGVASGDTRRMHAVIFVEGIANQALPVEPTPLIAAQLSPVLPLPGSVLQSSGPVTLQWQSNHLGILYYQIQISADPTFNTDPLSATSFVWDNVVHGLSGTPPNSFVTPELPGATTLYWRVRPRVDTALLPITWSPAWSFSTP